MSDGRLVVQELSARDLTESQLEEIWTFYGRFVTRPKTPFLEAVRQTRHVFLGREPGGGAVRAFAASTPIDVDWQGRRYGVMYAAYGGIDPAFRGTNIIQRAGLATFLAYRQRHPLRGAYFMMMASTYTSYLMLTRNFPRYWPRRDDPTPPRERVLMDLVMRQVAGASWDAEAGVVRRHGRQRYLEGVVADEGDYGDADIAFYGRVNPRQDEGDSLACIAPLDARTWSFMAYRAARRRLRGTSTRRS